jgi:hypothetical protein
VKLTAFFSWQSDTLSKEGRNFIEKALKTAVARITQDVAVEEAVRDGLAVDKDTKDVPGSPPIFDTILKKISNAAIFVPDLTFVGKRRNGKPTPNPNVLIEYGWALKSLGYYQIIPVMNAAMGGPESMPFDMAHLRFPITYNLPEGAPEGTLKIEREELTKKLEKAVRTILGSEEFKAALPKEPEPPPFPQREPMNGRARFRAPGESLGVNDDTRDALTGKGATNVHLRSGAAIWLRVMPLSNPGRVWLNKDLRDLVINGLALLPLIHDGPGSTGLVRGEDGCGCYPITDPKLAESLCYVFNTGEVWAIDARQAGVWSLDPEQEKVPEYLAFDEQIFIKSLAQCCSFLHSLNIPAPYRWIVGIEGFRGRYLAFAPHYTQRWGKVCVTEFVEEPGIYKDGDDIADLLRPFFEKVFDAFGRRR